MSRELFGTDGVRGVAGEYPLDTIGTGQIGEAVGTLFAEPGELVLIGHDPRESSPHLVAGLAAGVTATGANVEVVGVIPTPGLAYLTRESDAAAGIMVTASHNKYSDNGVKVFDRTGGKLTDETETTMNGMITGGVAGRGSFGSWLHSTERVVGYENFLVASAEGTDLTGMRIAVDSANGAASGIAARVFTRLGADVMAVADKPDGRNINAGCGATHTEMLEETVVENGLDLGVALDGDADRLMLVDGLGRKFDGDHIMYTLATAGGHDGVVATVMTNLGAEQAMRGNGIDVIRAGVGDRYVLEGLRESGYRLGGEQSGHIILPERLATGDGMLAAIQAIRAVRESGLSLAEWRDQVELLPQALVNIPVPDKRLLGHESVRAYIDEVTDRLGGNGRVLIRPSGTEPLARVMVESPDAHEAAMAAAAGLERLLAGLSSR